MHLLNILDRPLPWGSFVLTRDMPLNKVTVGTAGSVQFMDHSWGVEQYIGWHLSWQSVAISVAIMVECPSSVGQYINQVAFYFRLRISQVLVNRLMYCHYDNIGRVSAMYQWTISRAWVRYWWCIDWQSASPVQFFNLTPSLKLFPLLRGTCQLTHGRHYCLLLHISAAADTGLISWQIMVYFILGDPGADSGGEGKSKRAEKYGT